jgi:iron complex transport system substrate-binding protein
MTTITDDHKISIVKPLPQMSQNERQLRVISLLSATTEMVYALGCGHLLVGRSHGCDYPPICRSLPILSAPKIDPSAPSDVIDAQVRSYLASAADGGTVYHVLSDELSSLQPDIVITQNQCRICAVTKNDLQQALSKSKTITGNDVGIVSVQPVVLDDIFKDITDIAAALGVEDRGALLCSRMKSRMDNVRSITQQQLTKATHAPIKVVHVEWLAPLMGSGHFIPELAEIASCTLLHATKGGSTPIIQIDQFVEADVILLAPCGFTMTRTLSELTAIGLTDREEWEQLPAVRNNRVFVADGNFFFNRSSPRLVESAEIFAEVAHDGLLGLFGHHGVNVVRIGEELEAYCRVKGNHEDKDLEGSRIHQRYLNEVSGNNLASANGSSSDGNGAMTVAGSDGSDITGSSGSIEQKQRQYPNPGDAAIISGGPCAAVEAQIACMRGDCQEYGFDGCKAAYLFNTIDNQKRLGSAVSFAAIVRSSAFKCFLDPTGVTHVGRVDSSSKTFDGVASNECASKQEEKGVSVVPISVICSRAGYEDVGFVFDVRLDTQGTQEIEGRDGGRTSIARWATDGVCVAECGRGGACRP